MDESLPTPVAEESLDSLVRAPPRTHAAGEGFEERAELGAFVAALGVATAANALARVRDRPAALVLVPGILFLVPGSVGFLGVRSMLDDDVTTGVETFFRMFLVAMAIAAGVLVATAAIPPRRSI